MTCRALSRNAYGEWRDLFRGVAPESAKRVRRAARLARLPEGVIVTLRPAREGWMAYSPQTSTARARLQAAEREDRLVGVYRAADHDGEMTVARAVIEDLRACLGDV